LTMRPAGDALSAGRAARTALAAVCTFIRNKKML
jgi:hypothetical protein